MKLLVLTLVNKYLSWIVNMRVLSSFLVGISLSVYFAERLLSYSSLLGNMLQVFEPYIYITSDPKTFGAMMMGGLLLLADAPFLTPLSQDEMLRVGRRKWVTSQILYIFLSSFFYFLVLILFTMIVCSVRCGAYFAGGWSDTLELLAFTKPSAAITNYNIGFDFPEMLQSISPTRAALESLLFQTLYLSLIGLLILCVNLYSRQNFGWIVGSITHFLGYLIYANSSFGMQAKYSLLCCIVTGFHYIPSMNMTGTRCFLIFCALIGGISQLCTRNSHRIEPFL